MSTTRLQQFVKASPHRVYQALVDRDAVQQWMVPDGMTSKVLEYDVSEGGKFRISLTYDDATSAGKSGGHTDTYHGTFFALVPDSKVVQLLEFETDDPAMQGPMTVTFSLNEEAAGTLIDAVHEGVPAGVKPEDNELGWRISMGKLAKFLESSP